MISSISRISDDARSRRPRWRGRGVLIAAAAAVLLTVIAGPMVAARSVFVSAPPFADVGTRTSPPPYYVEIDPNDKILVQSTATGRRTDIVTPPFGIQANTHADAAITVSANGRTFVAAYNDWDSLRTFLFRFTLTSSGRIAGFTRIRTGRLPGLTEPSVAISPDGTQIALAGVPDRDRSVVPSSGPPRLLVLGLRTGQVRIWAGLAGTGTTDSIQDPAWLTDRSLRFLVATCRGYRDAPDNAGCEQSGPTGREWALDVPLGLARLGPGRALVTLPGTTPQAVSSRGPGGEDVTALELLRSGGIRIARYDVPTGRQLKSLYQGKGAWKSNYWYDVLAADNSGTYVLVNVDLGAFFGWTNGGRFHQLPIHDLYGNHEIVAAAW